MSNVVSLIQGSDEWLAWRKNGIGASDAPVIEGISPYRTKRELYFEKTGKELHTEEDASQEYIFAKGHRVEGMIRQEFAELMKTDIQPVCMVHPKFAYIFASLDGFDPKLGVLEAKLVGQETLAEALNGNLPSHHYSQMQHQFAVSGADIGRWFGHDGKKNGALVEVRANQEYIKRLLDQEHEFWGNVTTKVAPPLSEKDYLVPEDESLLKDLREAKELSENAEVFYKTLKERVVEKYNHPRIAGAGIKLYRVYNQGKLNILNVPEIAALVEDAKNKLPIEYIEKFRGKSFESWTIRISGGSK